MIVVLLALLVLAFAGAILFATIRDSRGRYVLASDESVVLVGEPETAILTALEMALEEVEAAYLAEERPDPREFYDELQDVDYNDPPDTDPVDPMLDFD